MIIEKISINDIKDLHELQPEGWPDILPSFQLYVNSLFCHPVKIVISSKTVGIGASMSFGETSWLAHIIVDPEFRNKGIGTFIVNHLCAYLKGNGVISISLLATDLGFPLYKKAGFIEQTEYLFYERKGPIRNEISKNIVSFSDDDREEIIGLDRKISGESRANILRNKMRNSYIYKSNNKILGYYLPELGEGFIIAEDSEAGIELMKVRFLKQNKGILPVDNSDGIKFIQNEGFSEVRRAKRMILGEAFPWSPDKIYNRIAGKVG